MVRFQFEEAGQHHMCKLLPAGNLDEQRSIQTAFRGMNQTQVIT